MKPFRRLAIAMLSALGLLAVGVGYGLLEWIWTLIKGFAG